VRRWSFPALRVADGVATSEGRFADCAVTIARPLGYMNRSGRVLPRLLDERQAEPQADLLVLVDDVSLPPGEFRIRGRGSAGGHNGLASIEQALGTREYARLRIGVGSPHRPELDLADWVLAAPPADEESAVLEALERMGDAVECWLIDGVEPAMNRFN
jgi:PTH1 family peptidyl-tRNA hydrolase